MQKIFLISSGIALGLTAILIFYITFFTQSRTLVVCPVEAAGGICPLKKLAESDPTIHPCPIEHYLPKGERHTLLPKKDNSGVNHLRRPGEVQTQVPGGLAGWQSWDLPLSDSEVLNSLIGNALAFDSYGYRLYKKDDCEVTIYVAYWEPGKISSTDAGVHNPDSCWTNAGWTRAKRVYGGEYEVGSRKLKPLEYGIYERPGQGEKAGKTLRVPVIFWHLVGGEVNRYETKWEGYRSGLKGRIDRLPILWEDLKKYGLNQRREQMFVRISMSHPLEEMLAKPEFQALLTAIAPLAIFEGTSWETLASHADRVPSPAPESKHP